MNTFLRSGLVLISTLVASFSTVSALAYPLAPAGRSEIFATPNNPFVNDYNFEGIVGLNNCSGALFRLENSKETDKALILTNGHCLETGFPAPGKFVYGQPSNRAFRLFDAKANVVGRLTATHVVYSTMTRTDMTIYQLKETFAEIRTKFHINPLVLSSQHPALNEPIEVISGYWVRGYACAIEAFIPKLSEDGWVSEDSVRYSRPGCETIGGTSGSPIIRRGTRTIIGVNNTGNEDGQRCTMNNPCEIDKDGNVSAHQGYSYGQQTYWIYTCLNQYNELDLNTPGCQLPH